MMPVSYKIPIKMKRPYKPAPKMGNALVSDSCTNFNISLYLDFFDTRSNFHPIVWTMVTMDVIAIESRDSQSIA